MFDINGIEIKPGQKVRTRQYPGGVLPPAEPKIGIVEFNKDYCRNDELVIRVKDPALPYDTFILLNGKINEVIE